MQEYFQAISRAQIRYDVHNINRLILQPSKHISENMYINGQNHQVTNIGVNDAYFRDLNGLFLAEHNGQPLVKKSEGNKKQIFTINVDYTYIRTLMGNLFTGLENSELNKCTTVGMFLDKFFTISKKYLKDAYPVYFLSASAYTQIMDLNVAGECRLNTEFYTTVGGDMFVSQAPITDKATLTEEVIGNITFAHYSSLNKIADITFDEVRVLKGTINRYDFNRMQSNPIRKSYEAGVTDLASLSIGAIHQDFTYIQAIVQHVSMSNRITYFRNLVQLKIGQLDQIKYILNIKEAEEELREITTGFIEREHFRTLNDIGIQKDNFSRYKEELMRASSQIVLLTAKLNGLTSKKSTYADKFVKEAMAIDELPTVQDVEYNIMTNEIVIKTTYLDLYDENDNLYRGGEYDIRLDLEKQAITFDSPYDQRAMGYWGEEDIHPHISDAGDACFGNISGDLMLLFNENELYAMTCMLISFLSSCDTTDSAGEFVRFRDMLDPITKEVTEPADIPGEEYEAYCEFCDEGIRNADNSYSIFESIEISASGEINFSNRTRVACEYCMENDDNITYSETAEAYTLELIEEPEQKVCERCQCEHDIDDDFILYQQGEVQRHTTRMGTTYHTVDRGEYMEDVCEDCFNAAVEDDEYNLVPGRQDTAILDMVIREEGDE